MPESPQSTKRFDLRDALVISGLGLVGVGLWLHNPGTALTTVGGLLFALGILSGLRRSR